MISSSAGFRKKKPIHVIIGRRERWMRAQRWLHDADQLDIHKDRSMTCMSDGRDKKQTVNHLNRVYGWGAVLSCSGSLISAAMAALRKLIDQQIAHTHPTMSGESRSWARPTMTVPQEPSPMQAATHVPTPGKMMLTMRMISASDYVGLTGRGGHRGEVSVGEGCGMYGWEGRAGEGWWKWWWCVMMMGNGEVRKWDAMSNETRRKMNNDGGQKNLPCQCRWEGMRRTWCDVMWNGYVRLGVAMSDGRRGTMNDGRRRTTDEEEIGYK